MPLFNGAIPFTKKWKKDVDAKEKNETIDNAKQTILNQGKVFKLLAKLTCRGLFSNKFNFEEWFSTHHNE